jgi:hypothetical protein
MFGVNGGMESFFLIYFLFIIVLFIFLIISLIDIVKSEFKEPNLKIIWFLVVIFLGPIGIILYYTVGKNQRANHTYSNSNLSAQNYKQKIINTTYILCCPTCNNQLSKYDIFCKNCGINVQSFIQLSLLANCPSCTKNIALNDVFCKSCGYNIQQHKQTYSSNKEEKQTILLSSSQNKCIKCGNTPQVGDTFCENCGYKLN